MQTLKETYQQMRAPDALQARLLSDYERAQQHESAWPMAASAFALLFIGISAVWFYQPNEAPLPDAALETPLVRLSPAAAGLPGLTARTGRFSRLSLSELSTPGAGELSGLPTLPGVPPRPSS